MSMVGTIVQAIWNALGGSPMSIEEVNAKLAALAAKNPEKLDYQVSIVDLMKLLGLDSSLANREALAKELGYPGPYDGSAEMNQWLHSKVMDRVASGQIS